MDDQALKQLFAAEDIPAPNENARKVALNMAVAEFEKNEKKSQGIGFFARLISREPVQRRETMSFSQKKIVYGGLATACVALMVFAVLPEVTRKTEDRVMSGAAINPEAARKIEKKVESLTPPKSLADAATEQKIQEEGEAVDFAAKAPEMEMMPADREERRKADVRVRGALKKESSIASADMAMSPSSSVPAIPASPVVMGGVGAVNGLAVMPDEKSISQANFGRDKFKDVAENNIHQVAADPISTFSIDVDTASYSFARSSLDRGVLPQKDSVRVEEMINYFDYAYPLPTDKTQPFSTHVVLKPSPWADGKQLMTIGIKGYDLPKAQMPNSNLVFLLDVSGSMEDPNKLPLLKQSIAMLLDTLKPTDTVSIVVYAGAAGTVLPPTKAVNKGTILAALQNLSAGGSTAGAEGIRQAYQLAQVNFDKNAVNRVILGTDGDFNVGITNPEELKDFVSREKDKGIFLSVLGFGRGNYNDEMMQELAQNGNGVAAYIDSLNEARKVLVEEATSTLFPIAKDVKIQVEFNPATVAEYRLVGYETRALRTEDFNNDKVDAGDIGAGAEVTAIYEIAPVGGNIAIDGSRYNSPAANDKSYRDEKSELAFVKVRYKLPNENESKLIETPVLPENMRVRKDMSNTEARLIENETNWAVAVASFGQMLKGGAYTGKMTYDDVIKLAEVNKGQDPFGYRAEFINLVHKAKSAASLEPQPAPMPINPDGRVYTYPVPASE